MPTFETNFREIESVQPNVQKILFFKKFNLGRIRYHDPFAHKRGRYHYTDHAARGHSFFKRVVMPWYGKNKYLLAHEA
jgi:hypothetical protein